MRPVVINSNSSPVMRNVDASTIKEQMDDAHLRTRALINGLSEYQLMGPKLPIINPLLWEIGHVSYFYEFWVLRQHLGRSPILANADQLYDSITIAHDERWDLPLPGLAETLSYIDAVQHEVSTCLRSDHDETLKYLAQYAVFHHDMHNEAFTYTRQTLSYPAPDFGTTPTPGPGDKVAGDAFVPGGHFMLGAMPGDQFVFDNEKWAHQIEIRPFRISRTAVSNADYLAFVEAGGYSERNYWDDAGWAWREANHLQHPLYWLPKGQNWQLRWFDRLVDLPLNAALIHVSWYEAQAYCRWAQRRLPTEAEWEAAAAAEEDSRGMTLSGIKREFPWGDYKPTTRHANLDGYALGCIDVSACSEGDSAFGCRQMTGNVWEWTEDTFKPYPGFTPDMYADYSEPLFNITKVLRGGCWATRGRMLRNTWRTYYGPERNDVFAGFRTCAL